MNTIICILCCLLDCREFQSRYLIMLDFGLGLVSISSHVEQVQGKPYNIFHI